MTAAEVLRERAGGAQAAADRYVDAGLSRYFRHKAAELRPLADLVEACIDTARVGALW